MVIEKNIALEKDVYDKLMKYFGSVRIVLNSDGYNIFEEYIFYYNQQKCRIIFGDNSFYLYLNDSMDVIALFNLAKNQVIKYKENEVVTLIYSLFVPNSICFLNLEEI